MSEIIDDMVNTIEELRKKVERLEKQVETNQATLSLAIDIIDGLAKKGREETNE